jgi:hypothetical protein
MESYKNRILDRDKPVEMYRCLNRSGFTFSIRQFGKVIGHTDNVVLVKCSFHVNPSGKKKCLDTKTRNVHAYIKGYVAGIDAIKNTFKYNLFYDPFSELGFHGQSLGNLPGAKVVFVEDRNIVFQI